MKAWIFMMSILAAAGFSAAVAMYAVLQAEKANFAKDTETGVPVHQDPRLSLFPEQHRAVDDLMKEIMAREKQQEQKEKALKEQEAQLRQEEIVLLRLRDDIEATKQSLQKQFEEMDEESKANIRKLAEFYAKMESENAASLLMKQDIEVAARILSQLQDRQAGAIMDAAVAQGERGIENAAIWSEGIRKIRNEPK